MEQNSPQLLSVVKLAYMAGLIDGEGTVSLRRNGDGKARFPVVHFNSTTVEMVSWAAENFGGRQYAYPARKVGHKPYFHWLSSRGHSLTVLSAILPYMLEPKKRARAELILSDYRPSLPGTNQHDVDEADRRKQFEDKFFSL